MIYTEKNQFNKEEEEETAKTKTRIRRDEQRTTRKSLKRRRE
jgi:hypothetical protein